MMPLQIVIFTLVGVAGAMVVFTRDPVNQAISFSFFGLTLTVLFLVLQAPDVALSELAVGSAALPLIILVTCAKVRGGWDR